MANSKSSTSVHITEAAYALTSPDVRGVWTTERDDLPNWEEVRDQYVGKRTLMHRRALWIEGCGLEIVPNRHPHHVLMRIADVMDRLRDLYLQVDWVQISANDRRNVTGIGSAIDVIDQAPLGAEITVKASYPGGRYAALSFNMADGRWHFIASADVQDDLYDLLQESSF